MNTTTIFSIIGFASAIWSLISYILFPIQLLANYFGWRSYYINSQSHGDKVNILYEHIIENYALSTQYTYRNEKLIPIGTIICWQPFCWVTADYVTAATHSGRTKEYVTMTIFTHQATFEALENMVKNHSAQSSIFQSHKSKKNTSTEMPTEMHVILKEGPSAFDTLYYSKKVEIPILQNFPHQQEALQKIHQAWTQSLQNGYKTMTVLVTGPPNTGKSQLATLLAIQLQGSLCTHYNPSLPGQYIMKVTQNARSSRTKPLIILVDEYDVIVRNMHQGSIPQHADMNTEVIDKRSHNQWLDLVDQGLFVQYVILLLTTNQRRKWFKALDPSYVRDGRIHLTVKMDNADIGKQMLKSRLT